MKVLVEFDYYDDNDELSSFLQNRSLCCAISDFLSRLRDDYKYGSPMNALKDIKDHTDIAEKISEELRSTLIDHGVNLDCL